MDAQRCCSHCGQNKPLAHFEKPPSGRLLKWCWSCKNPGAPLPPHLRTLIIPPPPPSSSLSSLGPTPEPPSAFEDTRSTQPQKRTCTHCAKKKDTSEFSISQTGAPTNQCNHCLELHRKRSAQRQASTPAQPPAPKRDIRTAPPQPQFLLRGQHSQDTPAQAAARRAHNKYLRDKRQRDRGNSSPSPERPLQLPHNLPSPQPHSSATPSSSGPPTMPSFSSQGNNNIGNDHIQAEPPSMDEEEWGWGQDFLHHLYTVNMDTCSICNERWVEMGIKNGECASCYSRDTKRRPGEPRLMSAANMMDPGAVPEHLPALRMIEEMLIARVQILMQVSQVRGQQYKYTGHVISFLSDTATVYNKLPILPKDLDIIILRPRNMSGTPAAIGQFGRSSHIRQSVIRDWLHYLKRHHPGYHDVEIDEVQLSQLPEDGDVQDQFETYDIQDAAADEPPPAEFSDPDVSAIPDLLLDVTEQDLLRQAVHTTPQQRQPQRAHRPHLTFPDRERIPLSEYGHERLLSLAFPSLYPQGLADFKIPRLRAVELPDYVQHLMKYKDGRFSSHPRWRYAVFNQIMRAKVTKAVNFFMKREGRASVEAELARIQNALAHPQTPEAKSLLAKIMRRGNAIEGTRPFWTKKRYECEAMVYNLGTPSLFSTFTAADQHWDALQRLFPRYDEWKAATEQQRMRLARENLTNNPAIAAWFFMFRFKALMKFVLAKKFNITAYWFRCEFQGRGSTHVHGFTWHDKESGPQLHLSSEDADLQAAFDKGDFSQPAVREAYIDHWTEIITGVGNRNRLPDDTSPLALSPDLYRNTRDQLHAIVNRVLRHTCGENKTCQRRVKGSNPPIFKCRFYFPKKIRDTADINRDDNPQSWKFHPIQNEDDLVPYIPTIIHFWSANCDSQVCLSAQTVMNYIVKYASKSEKATVAYTDILHEIAPKVNANVPLRSAATKMLNRLVGERDYSAQEVCHLLLKLPLAFHSDEKILDVNCRSAKDQNVSLDVRDGELRTHGKSSLQRYMDRGEGLSDLTYLEFLRNYDFYTLKARPRAKPRILSYYPRYKNDKNGPMYEDYCRVKLTLHRPFHSSEDRLKLRRGTETVHFETWSDAWHDWSLRHRHTLEPDFYDEVLPDAEEEEFEDEVEEDDIPQSWMAFGRGAPMSGDDDRVVGDELGLREMDLAESWIDHVMPDLSKEWWKERKDESSKTLSVDEAMVHDYNKLEGKQRLVFDRVTSHFQQLLQDRTSVQQLLLHVDGRAGTGKSFLIWLLSSKLEQLARDHGRGNPVIRAAPTGVAAYNISGRTLHSLFSLPVRGEFQDSNPETLAALQARFDGCDYLIIDEKSMIGLHTLAWISRRCREIRPHDQRLFGGFNILLFGDFCQLPPVMAKELYAPGPFAPGSRLQYNEHGRNLYQEFNRSVELDVVMRQRGQSEEQQQFRDALEGLRSGDLSVAHWTTLMGRAKSALTSEEVKTFDNALHIYGTKSEVATWNSSALENLNHPVLILEASHTGPKASDADFDVADNLLSTLKLAIGARVMLTRNLWVEQGVVNGSQGVVMDIVWDEGTDPRRTPPRAVLVKLDAYEGPQLQNGTVPIFRQYASWGEEAAKCSRTQFPLILAYAITVHKSQGITVDKAVMDLSGREFEPGLRYVAVSRVKTLQGLLLDHSVDYSRLRNEPSLRTSWRMEDAERRALQPLE